MSSREPASQRARLFAAVLALAAIAVLGILLVRGFMGGRQDAARESEDETAIKAPQRISVQNGMTTITLDDAAQTQGGIETAALSIVSRGEWLRGYATVLDVGPLLELSKSFASARAQVRIAEAKLDASRRTFERAKKLNEDDQNVSTAQLQAAEGAQRIDAVTLGAAQSQLQSLDAAARQAWGPVLGRALVDDGPLLKQLLMRETVLVQVTLSPGAATVKAPTEAFIAADNGQRTKLRLVSSATRTDTLVQGASFLYTAPASSGLLPGMMVPASLGSDKVAEGTIVPASAVVWWRGRPWVYVRASPETFVRRELVNHRATGEGALFASNFPDSAETVVQGAQMLLSEELRAQIRLTGEDQHP